VDFMTFLASIGFTIRGITFDQFQSRMPIQILQLRGFTASKLSIQLEHYKALRDCVTQHRASYYAYAPALKELKEIVRTRDDSDRPHHPFGGSDDIADAMAGVAAHCCGVAGKNVVAAARISPLLTSGSGYTGLFIGVGTSDEAERMV